jgi:hypothetical protein
VLNNRKDNNAYLSTFEHTALLPYKLYQFYQNFVRLHCLRKRVKMNSSVATISYRFYTPWFYEYIAWLTAHFRNETLYMYTSSVEAIFQQQQVFAYFCNKEVGAFGEEEIKLEIYGTLKNIVIRLIYTIISSVTRCHRFVPP